MLILFLIHHKSTAYLSTDHDRRCQMSWTGTLNTTRTTTLTILPYWTRHWPYYHCSFLFEFGHGSGLLLSFFNVVYGSRTRIQLTVYSSRRTIVNWSELSFQESWKEQARLTQNDSSLVFWCFLTWKLVIFLQLSRFLVLYSI